MEDLLSIEKEKLTDILQHNIDLTSIVLKFKSSAETKAFIERNKKAKEKFLGIKSEDCCSDNKIYLYENLDTFERVIKDSLSRHTISRNLKSLILYLGERYYNIIDKSGAKDVTEKDEKYLVGEVLKKGLTEYFKDIIAKEMEREQNVYGDMQYLVADPKKETMLWDSMVIPSNFETFMHKGYLKVQRVCEIPVIQSVVKQIDLMEKMNVFDIVDVEKLNVKYYDIVVAHKLDEKHELRALYDLCKNLAELPHYINRQVFQHLRVIWAFRVLLVKDWSFKRISDDMSGEYGRIFMYLGNTKGKSRSFEINYNGTSLQLDSNELIVAKNTADWDIKHDNNSDQGYSVILEGILFSKVVTK